MYACMYRTYYEATKGQENFHCRHMCPPLSLALSLCDLQPPLTVLLVVGSASMAHWLVQPTIRGFGPCLPGLPSFSTDVPICSVIFPGLHERDHCCCEACTNRGNTQDMVSWYDSSRGGSATNPWKCSCLLHSLDFAGFADFVVCIAALGRGARTGIR